MRRRRAVGIRRFGWQSVRRWCSRVRMKLPKVVFLLAPIFASQAAAQVSDHSTVLAEVGVATAVAVQCEWATSAEASAILLYTLTEMRLLEKLDLAKYAFGLVGPGCDIPQSDVKRIRADYDKFKAVAENNPDFPSALARTSRSSPAPTLRRPEDNILRNCQARHKDNYEMIEYCVGKQRAAKQRLGID